MKSLTFVLPTYRNTFIRFVLFTILNPGSRRVCDGNHIGALCRTLLILETSNTLGDYCATLKPKGLNEDPWRNSAESECL